MGPGYELKNKYNGTFNPFILKQILQPSPVNNMSAPSPVQLNYQIPSPATVVQPGKYIYIVLPER